MRILVTGADGFLGARLVQALRQRGHQVVRAVRRPQPEDVGIDYRQDRTPQVWLERVAGFEVVINAVGIPRGDLTAVHEEAPRALFAACAQAGVRKVVQISALGADEEAQTRFHNSKRGADEYLASLPLEWVVVLPSVVIGRGGLSTQLFSALAALPVIFLPGGGQQQLQPILVEDLIKGLVALVESDVSRVRLNAVGPRPLSLAGVLRILGAWLGLRPAPVLQVPAPLVTLAARIGDRVGRAPLTSEMVKMLERGNTAAVEPWIEATGVEPRSLEEGLEPACLADRQAARLYFVRPLLRWSVAFIWLVTAFVCAFVYPVADSLALLAAVGLQGPWATLALYGACCLDAGLGVWLLLGWRVRTNLLLQLLLIGGYSLVIAWAMPEYWLHPFGPITKNIPLMGAILALWAVED